MTPKEALEQMHISYGIKATKFNGIPGLTRDALHVDADPYVVALSFSDEGTLLSVEVAVVDPKKAAAFLADAIEGEDEPPEA